MHALCCGLKGNVADTAVFALFSFLSKTTALILSAAGGGGVNAEDSQLSPISGIALVQSEMNHPS